MSGAAADPERATGAAIVQKTVTDFKDFNHDLLGKAKPTGAGLHGLPSEHAYGQSTLKDLGAWGTKECIEGNASVEEQMPDADLGRPCNRAGEIYPTRYEPSGSQMCA